MFKTLTKFSFILFFVCLVVKCEENEQEHFTVAETKDSSYGEVIIADYIGKIPYGKIEVYKNGQLFYRQINTTVLKYETFRKIDNIVKVEWKVQTYQYIYIYLHRYSLDGIHTYTNNISGVYNYRFYYQSTGNLYGSYTYQLYRENIELGLKGFKTNRIELTNQKEPVEFDCKFDLRQGSYYGVYSGIRVYLNDSVLIEYSVVLPNATNGYLQQATYSLPGWLVNGRATGTVTDNSFSVVLSDVDQDLSGKYYCEIDYRNAGSTTAYNIKSNFVYLKIK